MDLFRPCGVLFIFEVVYRIGGRTLVISDLLMDDDCLFDLSSMVYYTTSI